MRPATLLASAACLAAAAARTETILSERHLYDLVHTAAPGVHNREAFVLVRRPRCDVDSAPLERELQERVQARQHTLLGSYDEPEAAGADSLHAAWSAPRAAACAAVLHVPVDAAQASWWWPGQGGPLAKFVSQTSVLQVRVELAPGGGFPDAGVALMWRHTPDDAASETAVAELRPGEQVDMTTFVGTVFYARPADDPSVLLGTYIVSSDTAVLTVHPGACAAAARTCYSEQPAQLDLAYQRDWSHTRRHLLISTQPPLLPKFTPIGTAKMAIPEPLWSELKEWWDANKSKQKREGWSADATQVNFHEVETRMVNMNSRIRNSIIRQLQPVHEEWAGGVPLEYTSLYGARSYGRGSILEKHIDRTDTHVISSIINLDQDVDEDWDLEVHSHDGKLRRLAMKPGEMILYESATVAHGRPTPLNGSLYSSIFLHFRPSGGEWGKDYIFLPNNTIKAKNEWVPLNRNLHAGTYQKKMKPFHELERPSRPTGHVDAVRLDDVPPRLEEPVQINHKLMLSLAAVSLVAFFFQAKTAVSDFKAAEADDEADDTPDAAGSGAAAGEAGKGKGGAVRRGTGSTKKR